MSDKDKAQGKSNVIKFPVNEDSKFSYFETDTGLGIQDNYGQIQIAKYGFTENSYILHLTNNDYMPQNREDLAEFLWAAATFLDSEEKYRPKVELVGKNYE